MTTNNARTRIEPSDISLNLSKADYDLLQSALGGYIIYTRKKNPPEAKRVESLAERLSVKAEAQPAPEATPQTDERLLNLLAVIHRDGGHYVSENGLDKACADVEKIVAERNAASPAPPVRDTLDQKSWERGRDDAAKRLRQLAKASDLEAPIVQTTFLVGVASVQVLEFPALEEK